MAIFAFQLDKPTLFGESGLIKARSAAEALALLGESTVFVLASDAEWRGAEDAIIN